MQAVFETLYTAEWAKSVKRANGAYRGADGEAIAAQTFANIWARRESLDWSRPGALLNTSLTNAIIDARRARRETISLYNSESANGLAIDVASPEPTGDAMGRLLVALESLTEDQRAVLVMRGEEKTFGQIGQALGISEDAAKKLARRARARLERLAA